MYTILFFGVYTVKKIQVLLYSGKFSREKTYILVRSDHFMIVENLQMSNPIIGGYGTSQVCGETFMGGSKATKFVNILFLIYRF